MLSQHAPAAADEALTPNDVDEEPTQNDVDEAPTQHDVDENPAHLTAPSVLDADE